MANKKGKFNIDVYEERVLRIMRRYYDWMNVNEVADESNIHWKTAKRSLDNLNSKGYISYKEEGGRGYWKAKRKDS